MNHASKVLKVVGIALACVVAVWGLLVVAAFVFVVILLGTSGSNK